MIQSDQDIRNRLMAARLPAMPQILLKLLQLCQADGAGMAEIARLVANDAGMAARLLQVANSAAYQRSGQKAGLMQALGALGLDTIKTLVINASVLQAFSGFAVVGTDLRRFWSHAVGSAVVAREIARAMDYAQPEEAYLAGLLHDVGRLALLAVAPEAYAAHFHGEDNAALCELEQRVLQITHVQAGAHVVQQWNLDSFLADAILYHHEPAPRLEGAHPLIRVLHLAQQLVGHDPAMPLDADAGALCGLAGEPLLAMCQAAASQVHKAASYLGIDLAGMPDWVAPSALAPVAAKPDAAQLRLGEEVRNLTLLGDFAQALARQSEQAQALKVLRQHAQLLLGLADAAVFLPDAKGTQLRCAAYCEAHQRLDGFCIPMGAGGGLVEAVRQQRLHYLERQAGLHSLADEQLLRVFQAEVLLCLPLVQKGRCLGLLVGGLAAWQMAELQVRERFVLAFGAQALGALRPGTAAGAPTEAQLEAARQQQRDSARRVAHEVNNPLAIIKNYLEVLDDKLARQEPVAGELGVLQEEIARIGNIMGEFAGSAALSAPSTPTTCELNAAVNKLLRLLRESRYLPPTVDMVVRLPEQPCEIVGSPDTLQQILLNLVKNAVEVLPKGGRIEIVNNGQVLRNGRSYYALCVSDNGPGIPSEIRSKLFAPVASTKPGANRGIGLSIVQGLVRQLGGMIACVSTSAQGTMFEICLPLPGAAVAASPAPAAQDFV